MAEPGLPDQVDGLQPNPVRPAQELVVGDRSPPLQLGDDVVGHGQLPLEGFTVTAAR